MDDFKLIQGCLTENKRAWDEFVDRFSTLIYDAILRTFREYGYRGDNTAAADLHNEVFVLLLEDNCRALRLFEGRNGCRLGHYIRTVTIRKTIDYMRKSRLMFSLDEESSDDNARAVKFVQGLAAPDVLAPLEEKEAFDIVRTLLAELKEEERNLCMMIFREEKDPRSIAEEFGISVDHFYVNKNRVLSKLRAIAAEKNYLAHDKK